MKVILGEKKEMTQLYTDTGAVIPVTIVDVSGVKVVGKKVVEKDGYAAVLIGKGQKHKATKAEIGKYKAAGFVPRYTCENKVEATDVEIGAEISPAMFTPNEKVDVEGTTKGKGYQGVVKRWGFHGGPKTHGQSDKHRHPGAIGTGTTPGRVLKGLKMGGRMGGVKRTIKNLRIVAVDEKNGLIAIKGAIPGPRGSIIIISATSK